MSPVDKERLKNLAQNPRFIRGIYNYCDRWCERCPFTARCLSYAIEEEDPLDPEAQDLENEAFWQRLNDTFGLTLELLNDLAEEQNIDLDAVAPETLEEDHRLDEAARSHVLAQKADAYIQMVDDWFKSSQELFQDKEKELNLNLQLGLPDADPQAEAFSITDAVEVIRWYQYFIYVKLMRALRGAEEERLPELEGLPKDSDGSAKIALIAMDRSIAAWGELSSHFPEKTDSILDLLIHLSRLQRSTEEVFPEARAFVRPGFDEVPDRPEPDSTESSE